MSFFNEMFLKITRKTPAAPPIIFNSRDFSNVVVDSRTSISRLQGQCIQPQVGMYSVLTVGDHLDVVVRFEKMLPYTLPVSSDEDCPQVTYVVPRQDMKIGDSFTLFVGREHFMVEVVQVLLKPSSSYGSEEKSDTSFKVDISNASRTWQSVQSNMNMHPGRHSPSADYQQDRDALGLIPPSPQPIYKPIRKPLPPRAGQRDDTVCFTRTKADSGKIQSSTRASVPVDPVPAISSSHPGRVRHALVDPDPSSRSRRPSDKIHQINPSEKLDISYFDINVTLQAASSSPPTTIRPSRRSESSLPPTRRTILDDSKETGGKGKGRERSTAERNNI